MMVVVATAQIHHTITELVSLVSVVVVVVVVMVLWR